MNEGDIANGNTATNDVPIATFEQDEDLTGMIIIEFLKLSCICLMNFKIQRFFIIVENDGSDKTWTCKKCTLVNSGVAIACVVCGGSKLRSITTVEDMTLRKGEFW